jgi:hypothetical protein
VTAKKRKGKCADFKHLCKELILKVSQVPKWLRSYYGK